MKILKIKNKLISTNFICFCHKLPRFILNTGSKRITNMSKIVRKIINSTALPPALGPYSQAVMVDNTVYLSGNLGIDASGK